MAIVFTQLATGTASTSNTNSYAATAGTPAEGDLLIAFVIASDTVAPGSFTGGGFNWKLLTSFTKNGGLDTFYIFWAIATSATSTTPTFNCSGDNATGCSIYVLRVTGDQSKIRPFIRQFKTNTGTTANPSVTLSEAILTGSGVCGLAGNGTNSAAQWTQPSSWSENSELAYNTPSNSFHVSSRASGETGSTITWTNANTTAWGAIVLEISVDGSVPFPPIDTTPKKKLARFDPKQQVPINLLGTAFADVPIFLAEPAPGPKRIKLRNYEGEPSPNLLLSTFDVRIHNRKHAIPPKIKLVKVKPDEIVPNLLASTLGEVAPADDPFVIVDSSLKTKQIKFRKDDETLNLNTSTLFTGNPQPRQRNLLPALERVKIKVEDVIVNLLNSTLTPEVEGDPFVIADNSLRTKPSKVRFSQDVVNLILSTLTEIQPGAVIVQAKLDKRKPRVSQDHLNLLVTTLTPVVVADPYVNQDNSLKLRKINKKLSEEFNNPNLVLSSVFSFIQPELDRAKQIKKVKLDFSVPFNLTLIPTEFPFKQVELDRAKRPVKKKISFDSAILPISGDPGFPLVQKELDRTKGKRKYKLTWDQINQTVNYPAPVNPTIVGQDQFFRSNRRKLRLRNDILSRVAEAPGLPIELTRPEEYRFNINNRLKQSKERKNQQELRNATLIPLTLRNRGAIESYLRRYLNDRDGLDQDDPGTPHPLNTEVSIDKKLTNYLRRYLNDKTTEQ